MSPKKKFSSALLRINGRVVKHAWVNTGDDSDESSDESVDQQECVIIDEINEFGEKVLKVVDEWNVKKIKLAKILDENFDCLREIAKETEEKEEEFVELTGLEFDHYLYADIQQQLEQYKEMLLAEIAAKITEEANKSESEEEEAKSDIEGEKSEGEEGKSDVEGEKSEEEEAKSDVEEEKSEEEEVKSDVDGEKSEGEEAKSDVEGEKLEEEEAKSDVEGEKLEEEEAKSDAEDSKYDIDDKKFEAEETEPKKKEEKPTVKVTKSKVKDKKSEVENKKPKGEDKKSKIENKKPKVKVTKSKDQETNSEPDETLLETQDAEPTAKETQLKMVLRKSKTEAPKPKTNVIKKPITKPKLTKRKRKSNIKESNPSILVSIGPNKTKVPECVLDTIDWSQPTAATRKLLMTIFDRETLAFHTLTGKPSPAFIECNRPTKNQLNPKKVADIIHIITDRSGVQEKDVRSAITTKCADENKMFKQREKRRKLSLDENKENIPLKTNSRRSGKNNKKVL